MVTRPRRPRRKSKSLVEESRSQVQMRRWWKAASIRKHEKRKRRKLRKATIMVASLMPTYELQRRRQRSLLVSVSADYVTG